MSHTSKEEVYRRAKLSNVSAALVFDRFCSWAEAHGLNLTQGDGSIELTHGPSGAVLLRLRDNARIEIPFDSMEKSKALTGQRFKRDLILALRNCGFAIPDDASWPGVAVGDAVPEDRAACMESVLERLVRRADSIRY